MQCLTVEKMRSVKLLWAGKKYVAPKHQEVLCRVTHPAGTPASWWGWGAALLGSHVALLRHNKVTAVSVADLSGSLQLYQICAVSWSRTSWPNLWHWSMLDIKLHFLKVNLKGKGTNILEQGQVSTRSKHLLGMIKCCSREWGDCPHSAVCINDDKHQLMIMMAILTGIKTAVPECITLWIRKSFCVFWKSLSTWKPCSWLLSVI